MSESVDPGAERDRLEAIAADSWYEHRLNAASIRYRATILGGYSRGTRCLELGPAEGLVTRELAARFDDLTLVDASEHFCEMMRARFPSALVVCSLFEEFAPAAPFDTVVLGHVLEHVGDPVAILRAAAGWLAPQGVVLVTVPNALSVHRQAAVLMGLLADEHELNATDHHHGHRRVYDPTSLRADIERAGLQVEQLRGYWLKPLANAQMEEIWSDEQIAAFMQLGERFPDIAAELYAVASA